MTSASLSRQPLPGPRPADLSTAFDVVDPLVLFEHLLQLALKTTSSPDFLQRAGCDFSGFFAGPSLTS